MQNKAIFDKVGITKWHEAGYTGKNGLTMTYERFKLYPIFGGKVERLFEDVAPFYEKPLDHLQYHGFETAMVHLQVAPDRKIVQVVDFHKAGPDGRMSGFIVDTLVPWIQEHKPDTGYRSLQDNSRGFDDVYAPILDYCTLVNAAGNDASTDYADNIADKCWLGIGAVALLDGKFVQTIYSSESEFIDFCAVGELYIPDENGNPYFTNGTSSAAPFISGMMALVNDFFIQKIGRPLSRPEMYEFVKANTVDITEKQYPTEPVGVGKDNKTGWGVFVLPDPSTIDLSKYIKPDPFVIKMKIGSNVMTVNGVQKTIDQPPVVDRRTNRALVPLRAIAEALECTVRWDPAHPDDITIIK